jgi:hypothetical protein
MLMKNNRAETWYKIFRIALGAYLLQHFLALLPWGTELFSSAGVLPARSLSPLMHVFPNIFLLSDSPLFVKLFLIAAAIASAMLIAGKFDRVAAALLWYAWACLYGRNPMIANPSLPFIGWMLLAYAFAEAPESRDGFEGLEETAGSHERPANIYVAAWILMSVAYLYSGYTKLASPSWLDGTALARILENPLARDTPLRILLLGLPPLLLKIATSSALTLELCFAPLALSSRLRPLLWLTMTSLHIGLLFLINFADLTAGMLVLHLFTFDPAWLKSCPISLQPRNLSRVSPGLSP